MYILHYPKILLLITYPREIFTQVYKGTFTKLVSEALFLLAIKLETSSMPINREPDKWQYTIKQLKWNELGLNA